MLSIDYQPTIQNIAISTLSGMCIVDVLRLDLLHNEVSGNKWFKLKYQLADAIHCNARAIATFGGVWSNHIASTAAACKLSNIPCTVFVRSDEQLITATLKNAKDNKADIIFVSREAYKALKYKAGLQSDGTYFIPEGGATLLGVQGAEDIIHNSIFDKYHTIYSSVGTGTTFTGLVSAARPNQQVVGISALKGNFKLPLVLAEKINGKSYTVHSHFHFGGFAKYTDELIQFMNNLYKDCAVPTDIVYTSKLFYACTQILDPSKKNLIIHSGGLQGNASLPQGTLLF